MLDKNNCNEVVYNYVMYKMLGKDRKKKALKEIFTVYVFLFLVVLSQIKYLL